MRDQTEILQMALDKWGPEIQTAKIQEEALELALILNQINCPTKDRESLLPLLYDELADMKIMMAQAEMIFNKARIDQRVKYKLKRLYENHLNPDNQGK